jgi:LacI family transcriptional regulator
VSRAEVTMQDVARRAGVHAATVSRFLHEDTRRLVNVDTAERVRAAILELGYEPNRAARSLRTRRSSTIGVVLPDLTNPLFPPMVRGLQDALDAVGYTALLANTDGDAGRERLGFETLRGRQVEGLLVATARLEDKLVDDVLEAGIPMVLVNRTVSRPDACAVICDDRAGVSASVAHLAELGHKRIAHLAGPNEVSTGLWREQAFRDAMAGSKLRVGNWAVRRANAFTEAAGLEHARALVGEHTPPTAIVAANDLLALACYTAAAERGLRCPEDLSVVGFNDMAFADRFDPPLTTVHVPQYDVGRRAAELLLQRLRDDTLEPETTVLETRLVIRGSTAPPPR